MRVNKLFVTNYRCHKELNFSFEGNLVIFYGDNATGKTSILEALHQLGLIKSFRKSGDSDLVMFGENSYLIKGEISNLSDNYNLVVHYKNPHKVLRKNLTIFKRSAEYIGNLNVVVFSNADLRIVSGNPQDRRKLFDVILCQISKDYMCSLGNYKRLLKERNSLLKRLYYETKTNFIKLLDIFDAKIINLGIKIINYRKKFIEDINKIINLYQDINQGLIEKYEVRYCENCHVENYAKAMHESRTIDIKKGNTNFGIHKDDYIFIINNKDIATYGSQGQQRNLMLNLKMAIIDLMFDKLGYYPILLLDDVLNELDKKRQNAFIGAIKKDVQTFITAASLSDINEEILNNAEVILLERR